MLGRIQVRLDHLFHSTRRITQVSIFSEVNGSHSAATNTANDLIARIEHNAALELLNGCMMAAGSTFLRSRIGSKDSNVVRSAPSERCRRNLRIRVSSCLLYTSDAADERSSVDL